MVVSKQQIETAVLLMFGFPILGIMLGGIYSVPAMKLTGEKDPWLTLLLILGLGCTVFGLGLFLGTPFTWSALLWTVGVGLLLASRKLHGSLGHNLERFGMVHAPILFISLFLGVLADRPSRKASKEGRPVPSIMLPLTPESFSSDPDNRKSNPKP